MASIAGTRPLPIALAETSRRRFLLGLATGLAAMAPGLVLDIALGGHAVITSALVLGPFVAALVGGTAPAAVLVAVALVLGVVSGEWNHNLGETNYFLRLVLLAVGGGLAVLTGWLRERSGSYSGRLEVLNQIGAIADGSLSLADTLERAIALIVPAAADLALIDSIHRGEVTRAAVRVRGRGDWPALETGLRSRTPSVPFWLRDPGFGIPSVPQFLPRVTAGHVEILSHGEEDRAFLASLGLRSALTVPMIARRRLLGTLTVAVAWSKRSYRRDDLAFIKTLAGRLALALDNAGLFSDLESVERRMDAVLDRIPEAVTVHEASGALVYANEAAARLIGMGSAEELVRSGTAARVARYELYTEDGERLPDDDLVERAVRGSELPVRGVYRLLVRETREERWIAVSVEPISGPDGNLLYGVTTIEDVTASKRAELAQRLLARVGELLQSSRDHRETLRRVAELAVPDFADWCAVSTANDDGTIELAAVAHPDPDRVAASRQLADRYRQRIDGPSRLAGVLRGEEPMLIEVTDEILRAEASDADELRELRDIGLGSAMLVPMMAGAKLVGALTFVNDRSSRRFDDRDLESAVEFGRRAGLAAENARIAELRIEINATLQRGLYPPDLPPMPGWRVATMYRPAGELNEVGGDFYEAFEVDRGWMIVLGDVVGRGAEAAALTALARHTLHTAGSLTGDPLAALSALNQRLRDRDPTPLCSAAVIVLTRTSADAAEATAVAAGHPLPLLVRGTAVSEAAAPGPLLGALADPEWETSRVEVHAGDQLVVYTDGVTDARSGVELFGEERLHGELAGSGRPETAVAQVERALASFAGGPVGDDAALVAIMREVSPVAEGAEGSRGGAPARA
jgi:PAS domain S-box-containing protein